MTARRSTSETDLAAVVIAWLEALGGDVYQEVELRHRGIRTDIVARVRAELWIIETKTSVSVALIEQAMERRRFAHRVYGAAPRGRAGADLCRELGIGVLQVDAGRQASVRELCPSRRWNSRPVALAAKLRPEHKTSARAGSPTGGHWTPFRDTCRQLEQTVRSAGADGIPLKAAIATRYHYSSVAGARASLATWIREGRMPSLRIDGGVLRFVGSP